MTSNNKPWITIVEYWSMETGEKLEKNKIKNYRKGKPKITYKEDGHYNIKTITYECGRNEQYKLW